MEDERSPSVNSEDCGSDLAPAFEEDYEKGERFSRTEGLEKPVSVLQRLSSGYV